MSEPAQDARAEFQAGVEALRRGDYHEAETRFRRSLELVPRPSTRYNLALVLFKLDRFEESLALVEAILAEGDIVDASLRTFAEALRSRLFAARPEPEADAGPPAEEPPAGDASQRRVPTRTEPERKKQTSLAPTSGGGHVGPWVTLGVGGALLLAGGVTGVLALRADDRFEERCPSLSGCSPSLRDEQATATRWGRITDVLLVSSAVVLAGGVTWMLVLPTHSDPQNHAYGIGLSARY